VRQRLSRWGASARARGLAVDIRLRARSGCVWIRSGQRDHDVRTRLPTTQLLTVAVLSASISTLRSSKALGDTDDESRIGQYFCVVDYAVGIMNSNNDKAFAGKVVLPDSERKFFVRIKRIERDQSTREICARSAASFVKAFNDGSDLQYYGLDLFGTSNFGDVCLAKYVAEIPMADKSKPNDVWSYRGLVPTFFLG
jgi:hypothetical protein